jgi:hypothetical protein
MLKPKTTVKGLIDRLKKSQDNKQAQIEAVLNRKVTNEELKKVRRS